MPQQTKVNRDQLILNCLEKFKVCSRNQLARLIFANNSNPVNVCNRVMKRLTLHGKVKQIPRMKDECYLYTLNPSPIQSNSNKINHTLKIVDCFLAYGYPNKFIIEPTLGHYEPDIFYQDKNNQSICVEIQLTPISTKKMQQKANQFVSEYGKEHDSQVLVISSLQRYDNVSVPKPFQIVHKSLPKEVVY